MTDITSIDQNSLRCRGNQLQCSARFDTRYAEPPRALVTMFAVQTSGMHCACVHTKCRHTLRMRSHELESDARFCCKSPPPPPSSRPDYKYCSGEMFNEERERGYNYRIGEENVQLKSDVAPSRICHNNGEHLRPAGSDPWVGDGLV